jgi:hypothetical protein
MTRGRREQGTIRGAKLRPRDLATEDLELVAQDEQLDVLDVQVTATANECPQQSPERHVRKREGHRADPPNPAREGRDTSIGNLQARSAAHFQRDPSGG